MGLAAQGLGASLLRKLLRQLDPLALRRELLIRAPVRPRFLRQTHLLERHRQIEMRVGVERVEPERFAIAGLRLGKPPEIVVDVAEIEVRFEEVRFETDRPLVERLRLHQLVAAVVDVREVDERGDEIRIVLERLTIRRRRLVLPAFVAIVEGGRGAEVLLGELVSWTRDAGGADGEQRFLAGLGRRSSSRAAAA